MKILLLGSGGREHTFAWKMAQSPLLEKLYTAPGNAGTHKYGQNLEFKPTDFESIKSFVAQNMIDMVVVGPEDPLVEGIHDYFLNTPELCHIPVIGPCKAGAMLEGSKDFAKAFMERHKIPTAKYRTFTRENFSEAVQYIQMTSPPYVLKADGLAAGKGVLIINDPAEAIIELKSILLENKFGQSGKKLVVEQFLEGIELSVFVLTDGLSYKILPEAKDYKRIGDGDTGPNTGGMGTVSGVPFADKNFMKKVEDTIIIPTIEGLKKEGIPYSGFLFIGLMNVQGDPYVIEYNVRMGDPETESVLPRIENDFVELLKATADKKLCNISLKVSSQTAATVMLVSDGYPGDYRKGFEIEGLNNISDSLVFHAGTTLNADGKVITNGGRVLGVTSLAETLEDALQTSYNTALKISFEGKKMRSDIGQDLLKYKP